MTAINHFEKIGEMAMEIQRLRESEAKAWGLVELISNTLAAHEKCDPAFDSPSVSWRARAEFDSAMRSARLALAARKAVTK